VYSINIIIKACLQNVCRHHHARAGLEIALKNLGFQGFKLQKKLKSLHCRF